MEAYRLWFGRPPARQYYRETTAAVMEAMDAEVLYRADGDPERSKHMTGDQVDRLNELADKAGPLIEQADVEEEAWAAFLAGVEAVE